MFKKNESTIDRALRVIVGAALLIAWYMLPDASYRPWLLIGIIPLVTGLIGWCAIYSILGISTDKAKKN